MHITLTDFHKLHCKNKFEFTTMEENRKAENYRDWLRENTSLSISTIQNYFYVIRRLLNSYPTPSVEQMNVFMNFHNREFYNTVTIRSALCHYLNWIGKPRDVELLKEYSHKGLKYLKSNVNVDKLKTILAHFPKGIHRDVFLIQCNSGCRQLEAFTIERKKCDLDENLARVLITQKGGATRTLVFKKDFLQPILSRPEYDKKLFPFLPDDCQKMSREDFLVKRYGTVRWSYWKTWVEACKKAGLESYSSHDVRRAVIRAVYAKFGLIKAQRVAGHARADTTVRYADDDSLSSLDAIQEVLK